MFRALASEAIRCSYGLSETPDQVRHLSLTFLIASIIVTVSSYSFVTKTPSWMCCRGFRLALISPSILAPARNCQSAFERFQRSRRTKWRSKLDEGAPTSCIAPPMASDPRSIATNPVLLTNSITSGLASVSSPDVKMTVRGLFGEKSCIQAIGMLLIDLTSRAPTGSTRPRPRRPSHEIAFSARLRGTSFKSALPGRQIGSRTWSGAGRGVSSDETKLELGSVDRRVAGFPGIGLQKKIRPLPVRQGLALTSDFEEVVIPGLKSFS
jgi:hypothetical protein